MSGIGAMTDTRHLLILLNASAVCTAQLVAPLRNVALLNVTLLYCMNGPAVRRRAWQGTAAEPHQRVQ
jgi:hypothetical protein